jgi:hypothetical protein
MTKPTITAIREALTDALTAVDGLRVYATVPDQPSVPAAIIAFAGRDPRRQFGYPGGEYQFSITCLVPRTASTQGQELLDEYASADADLSVQAAIEALTEVDGQPARATVTAIGPETAVVVDPLTYIGVEFSVAVFIS